MNNESWQRVEPTEIHKVGYRTVVTKHFELPNGETISFDTTSPEGQNDVATIALTPEKEVIIARIFRPGPEMVMEELPGGYIDNGEGIVAAGLRELAEESGFGLSDDSDIVELGSIPQQDAYSNSRKNYLLVTNVVETNKQKLETEETITRVKISIDKLIDNAIKGRMTDAVAVLMALDRLRAIQKEVNGEKTN